MQGFYDGVKSAFRDLSQGVGATIQGWCRVDRRVADFFFVLGYLLECAGS